MDVRIRPHALAGAVTPPPSKSMAHRLLLAAALADGIARLFNRCGRWCHDRIARGTDEMQQELPLFASG